MKYYSLNKKIDMYSYPARIEAEIVNFEKKHYCQEIKAYAYGFLETDDVITDEEKKSFGLVTEEDRQKKFSKENFNAEEYKKQKEEEAKGLTAEIEKELESYKTNPEKLIELAAFTSKFAHYSVKNAILLNMQCPEGLAFAGYKRWQELGKEKGKNYNVKAGERAYNIWSPNFLTYVWVSDDNKKLARYLTRDEQKKYKNGEYKTEMKLTGYSVGKVFEISQTTVPIEDYPSVYTDFGAPSETHKELCDYFIDYFESKGTRISIEPIKMVRLRGFYVADTNSITLADKLDDTAMLSTLLHEGGHSLLHYDSSAQKTKESYKEVQADYFSMLIEKKFGLASSDTRLEHLSHHLENCKNLKDFSLEMCIEEVTKVYSSVIKDVEVDVMKILERYKNKEKTYFDVMYEVRDEKSDRLTCSTYTHEIAHAYSAADVETYYAELPNFVSSTIYEIGNLTDDEKKDLDIIEIGVSGVKETEEKKTTNSLSL